MKISYVALAFLMACAIVPFKAEATYTLRDDATGGDCVAIGNWDVASKTCTISRDLDFSTVNENAIWVDWGFVGLTIDGNGHVLTGIGRDPGQGQATSSGVASVYAVGLTIKNLTITGFVDGMYFGFDSGGAIVIDGVTILNSFFYAIEARSAAQILNSTFDGAILLESGDGSLVSGNAFTGAGVLVLRTSACVVENNLFSGGTTGYSTAAFYIVGGVGYPSARNVVRGNTFETSASVPQTR